VDLHVVVRAVLQRVSRTALACTVENRLAH